MSREEKHAKLLRRFKLATSEQYLDIRKECFDFIVGCANSSLKTEINGMLTLINHIDGWVSEYESDLARRKEKQ